MVKVIDKYSTPIYIVFKDSLRLYNKILKRSNSSTLEIMLTKIILRKSSDRTF